jgi:hypothetical protein
MATHRVAATIDGSPRQNCKASGRRPGNALLLGSLRGRADLLKGGGDADHG